MPALNPDVALIHVQQADIYGNARVFGTGIAHEESALASKKVIVSAEEIIDTEEIRRDPGRTSIPYYAVDAVVHAPFGAWPGNCGGYYGSDTPGVIETFGADLARRRRRLHREVRHAVRGRRSDVRRAHRAGAARQAARGRDDQATGTARETRATRPATGAPGRPPGIEESLARRGRSRLRLVLDRRGVRLRRADAARLVGRADISRIKLGTSIAQISARTPAAMAMAAMTLDHLSGGRFILGLGASGPQVVEGWYGRPYPRPLERTREYVEIIRRDPRARRAGRASPASSTSCRIAGGPASASR